MVDVQDRILFVDDEESVRRVFARTLESRGFTVDSVASIEEAHGAILKNDYAVLAVDYGLPGAGDGLSLIDELARAQPNAVCVLVTGQCDLDLALKAVNEHSIRHVICKPWNIEELNSLMRRSVEAYWERCGQRSIEEGMVKATQKLREQKAAIEAMRAKTDQEVAELLLNVAALKGHETREHCLRVQAYTCLMAQKLGIEGKALADISTGALLHDIGNLGIPDSILLKAGPLDNAQWKLVRRHVEVGAELLSAMEGLEGPRQLVLEHHERWDGSGYPQGLSGHEISIGARIFAIADTLETLLSPRPWRKAWPLPEVVAEIHRGMGILFDPEVVAAFDAIDTTEWIKIRSEFPDKLWDTQSSGQSLELPDRSELIASKN